MCGVKSGLWNFQPDATDPVPGWQPGTPTSGVTHCTELLHDLLLNQSRPLCAAPGLHPPRGGGGGGERGVVGC